MKNLILAAIGLVAFSMAAVAQTYGPGPNPTLPVPLSLPPGTTGTPALNFGTSTVGIGMPTANCVSIMAVVGETSRFCQSLTSLTVVGANSLALGGATIGSNALGVTGTSSFSGLINASGGLTVSTAQLAVNTNQVRLTGASSTTAWTINGKGIIQSTAIWTDTSTATGTLATEYINLFASPTLAFSSTGVTVTNSYNAFFQKPTAGTNATLTNSYGIGTDALNVTGAAVNFTGLGLSTAADTLCYAVTTGLVTYETTGTGCALSAARFKQNVKSLSDEKSLQIILGMQPVSFVYKPQYALGSDTHYGFVAEQVQKIAPELVAYEPDKKQLHGVKYNELSPYIIGALRAEEAEIAALAAANKKLLRRIKLLERHT